jgi:hypothetical protein
MVRRADGTDSGFVMRVTDGKLYLSNWMAQQRDSGFSINYNKVAAELFTMFASSVGGVTSGLAQQIAGIAALVGAYWTEVAGDQEQVGHLSSWTFVSLQVLIVWHGLAGGLFRHLRVRLKTHDALARRRVSSMMAAA